MPQIILSPALKAVNIQPFSHALSQAFFNSGWISPAIGGVEPLLQVFGEC